jgi:hypothetical protein
MAHIVDRLRPVSQDLGCKAELEGLLEILDPAPAPSCSGPCTRGTVPSPTWSGTFWKPRRPSNLPTRTSRAPPCAPAGPVRVRPIPPVAGVVSKIGRLRIASLGASYPERLPKRGNRGGASYGERWIRGGFRGRRSGPGEGPQTLAQLQSTGAVVVGSDGGEGRRSQDRGRRRFRGGAHAAARPARTGQTRSRSDRRQQDSVGRQRR